MTQPPTLAAGVLTVGSALPDPPFELAGDPPAGLDIDLTRALAGEMSLGWRLVRHGGSDFNGIFAGLGRDFDLMASGSTAKPEREKAAAFGAPYLVSGQGLACDPARTSGLRSTADLAGRTLGVQQGNTSQPVAERLQAEGRLGRVAVYPYHAIEAMLDALAAGRIDAAMKLAPVPGRLHVERATLPLDAAQPARDMMLSESPPGPALDLHVAPHRQPVVTLTGTLGFVTRDGETFTLGPGDLLLAEDTALSGHRWRLTRDAPWRRAYVRLGDG